jgi:hypothetical protein
VRACVHHTHLLLSIDFVFYLVNELHPLLWSEDNVLTWLDQENLSDLKFFCAKYKIDGILLLLLPELGFDTYGHHLDAHTPLRST